MRIGIYTQPLRFNYGGLLQAWALQTVLEKMGHKVWILDPSPYIFLPRWKIPFSYSKRFIKKIFGKNPNLIHIEQIRNREYDIMNSNLVSFKKRIHTKTWNKISDIKEKNFDVIITGSDQVWRPKYNRSYHRTIENAFLDFTKNWNIKRIAYAASFGVDEWEFDLRQTKNCSLLVKRFDAISVRENHGVKLCKKYLNVEASHVLDPTLLLDKRDYDIIINSVETHQPEGNLLCYILDEDENKTAIINTISKEKNLKPFQTNSRYDNKQEKIENRIQISVEQWLRNFRDAEFIVTDSFHACIFSLIFEKPFIVIGNPVRGLSRVSSLLEQFGLSHRLIYKEPIDK
ncbi:MAG: polysaccharide pyruvyl transferase family protein, partial [Clostridia bacterium]|nr:polysaccharide pyruvyl transferase family protein [Clostridia bacterium]